MITNLTLVTQLYNSKFTSLKVIPDFLLSEARRQTRIVYEAFMEIVAEGKTELRQGDVIALLRARDHPLGIWKVTGEFSTLEKLNLITRDVNTGLWSPVPDADFDSAVVKYNGNWESLPTGR